uniref:NADH-ubiquinone oxidoreductase chain 1 n=1 Tax=Prionospio sp. 2 MH-2023 TaxID=3059270 RepID=A0AAU6QGS5_9ANNE
MPITYTLSTVITFVLILLAMAFFTLLERKVLGYIQLRKGPNKVGIMGLPQPFADALKLFAKEQAHPSMTNYTPFYFAPLLSLTLALLLWAIYPTSTPSSFLTFGILLFLCISSLNVYSILGAGWSSNSKYSLIGALRGVAQTISYEVSMSLILLSALFITHSYSLTSSSFFSYSWVMLMLSPMFLMWLVTILAETNRTPFDHAEGESELVSGFNTEYSSGPFALIFMAEYTSILAMSMFTVAIFSSSNLLPLISDLFFALKTLLVAFAFIWIRGTLPRMRYDRLMSLTWKTFLPAVITMLMILTPIVSFL